MLLHAAEKWPGAIHTCLWPYALRTANEVYNTIPNNADGTSSIERFSGSEVDPQLKNHHTFGCPIYMLNPNLQDKKHAPRWESRARIGIYLGPSPRHARSVSLVLKLKTGLVSTQYHVTHDDFFETVHDTAKTEKAIWKKLAGFVHKPKQPSPVHLETRKRRLVSIAGIEGSNMYDNSSPSQSELPPTNNVSTPTHSDTITPKPTNQINRITDHKKLPVTVTKSGRKIIP